MCVSKHQAKLPMNPQTLTIEYKKNENKQTTCFNL